MALIKFARGTYAKVTAATRDENTLYLATDKQALYLGDNLITSKVADATFADQVLTVSKVDGTSISLDFKDVASATGVNSLLATLRTDINKNKTDIANISTRLNTLSGQVTSNKVKAANKSIDVSTANASTAIKVNISSTANNQITLDANGLYVAKPAAYTGSNAIAVSGQTISLKLDGASLTQSANGVKASLSLKKMTTIDSSLASAYQLVDGAGTAYGDAIEIVKDQFLKDVSLDASNNLVFTFETTSGETTTKVNIAKYIDTYTAGNGITVTNKVIAAKVKTGDAYLTVDANGIASKGIDSTISTAVSNASTAWNTKLNAAKNEIDASIDALQAEVAAPMVYKGDTTTITQAVAGKVTTFSVKSGIYDAAGAANTVKTQLTGASSDASSAITLYGVKAHATAIATSKASAAQSAAISAASTDATSKANNALANAKTYTNTALTWIEL